VPDGFRLRVCYTKSGRLRFLSHLETVRACERAARRARLPYAVTQGFNPRMRLAFGPALPVGTGGEREYFDLWLTRFVPAEEACRALRGAIAVELAPSACAYAPAKEKSLAATLTIGLYEVAVEGGIPPEELRHCLDEIVASEKLVVEHKGKEKVFDLSDALPKEPEVRSDGDRTVAVVAVRMSERGSLRPEALVKAALAREVFMTTIRTDLFVEEQGAWRRPL
jgi:radical SAM-linked protein